MIWLIISVVCFLLLRNFLSKLEVDSRNGWNSVKLPLWGWILTAIACLVPIMNIIALICIELIAIRETRSRYPDIRFKEGKSHWLTKLIDFMNKEF
jgi:hypothetical protein